MGYVGGPTTQSPGPTEAQILSTKVDYVGASSMRARAFPHSAYYNKYYSPHANGAFTGQNAFLEAFEGYNEVLLLTPGTTASGSFYLEDAGLWPSFPAESFGAGYTNSGPAQANDALTAQRLEFSWEAPYTLTTIRGDAQISSVTVTGAKRGVNVAKTNKPTRGKLHYQIIAVGADRIIRWWCGTTLVAEGYRTGDGVVTCSEVNDSDIEITCTLTYTADVNPGTAFIELRWPASYQIHYSTSALAFPRAAELTAYDNGDDDYKVLTPILSGGTYNWNVLTVDDGGVVQSASFPVTVAKTIYTPPATPTIVSVMGDATGLIVTWTVGEAGCTFTAYSSHPNYPINFGYFSAPAPKTTALDAVTTTLNAITTYPGKVRIVVRATKGGVEEQRDAEYVVELDDTGAIVPPRPNRASVEEITVTSGLTVTVAAAILDNDKAVAATVLDLYLVALASAIDTTAAATASVNLDAAVAGVQRKSVSYAILTGAGWYRLAVVGRSAAGGKSKSYSEYILYVDDTAPGAVVNPQVKVIRGK